MGCHVAEPYRSDYDSAWKDALESYLPQFLALIEEETRMTYVTSIERVRLKREREQGREEGLEKGQIQGAADVLSTLLTLKFGPLPDWVLAHLRQADETAVKNWTARILTAQRFEDVFH